MELRKKHFFVFTVSAVVCVLLLFSCSVINKPPSPETVRKNLYANYPDIKPLIDYVAQMEYENIYFRRNSDTFLVGLERKEISEIPISESIFRLLDNNAYINISIANDTICLLQWTGPQDIGCGVAYSLNPDRLPDVEFGTTLIPIGTDGWYYYISDYNQWRSNQANPASQ